MCFLSLLGGTTTDVDSFSALGSIQRSQIHVYVSHACSQEQETQRVGSSERGRGTANTAVQAVVYLWVEGPPLACGSTPRCSITAVHIAAGVLPGADGAWAAVQCCPPPPFEVWFGVQYIHAFSSSFGSCCCLPYWTGCFVFVLPAAVFRPVAPQRSTGPLPSIPELAPSNIGPSPPSLCAAWIFTRCSLPCRV